ncbi:uncharacterized protein LOC142220506 [Haematobia irritans]|uniref:uncharacterized protein LOC142220506 n=1 Tax=Haematobia irritans TaxID=7368 RepID=UPI003F4FD15F
MLGIIWQLFIVLSLLTILKIEALPATTTTPATTHIVSYVHQRKSTKAQKPGQHDEFEDFDFENFSPNLTTKNPEMRGALQQLFGRFVENMETNMENVDNFHPTTNPKNAKLQEMVENNEIPHKLETDDLMDNQTNTLDTAGFGNNEQHESQVNETNWQRSKQSIPVLESVRHLVHSVRDGALNNTEHVKPERHHQLLNESMHRPTPANETSSAIETEEEREMIIESSDLRLLEVLGSIGSRVWGFFSSLKQVFAASTGSASAALSAQTSSSSS